MSMAYPLETMLKAKQRKRTPAQKQLAKEKAKAEREKLVKRLELQLMGQNSEALTGNGGTLIPRWEREFRFHPDRDWRFDLAWPMYDTLADTDIQLPGIAVEVHGGVYTQGRHTRGKGFTEDRCKINEAQLLGWTVVEVTAEHIDNGKALEWIERALA